MKDPAQIRTIAVVGVGAIGASWVALTLDQGYVVVACDPAPGAEVRLNQALDLMGSPRNDRLSFTEDPAAAAAGADLVIEAGPERLEVKRELFAILDAATPPQVLLTSSTSGILPSAFQDACVSHPERMLVAHPFNPPHLMPLVEIVGGPATSADAIDAAMATFTRLGKQPIHLRRELVGHVANRLQAALWREAYHLVGQGAVSAADLDTAIAAGPGLRWALMGPFATQHLSGGPGGFAHVIEHLGPPTQDWWDDLGSPRLTPQLGAKLIAEVDAEFAGTDLEQVRRQRDAALRELLQLKAAHGLVPADDTARNTAPGTASDPTIQTELP